MPCQVRVSVPTARPPAAGDVLAFLTGVQMVMSSEVVPLVELQGEVNAVDAVQKLMAAQTEAIQVALRAMEEDPAEMNVGQLLQLQFMVNLFSQLSTTATNIASAMNDAINAAARNIKNTAVASAPSDLRIVAVAPDALDVTLAATSAANCERLARLRTSLEQLLPGGKGPVASNAVTARLAELFASLGATSVSVA